MDFSIQYDYGQFYRGWELLKSILSMLFLSVLTVFFTLLVEALMFPTNAYSPDISEGTRNLRLVIIVPLVNMILIAVGFRRYLWRQITMKPDEITIHFTDGGITMSSRDGMTQLNWGALQATRRKSRNFIIELVGNAIQIPSRLLDEKQKDFIRSKVGGV